VVDVRVLDEAEYLAARNLFRGSMHRGPDEDDRVWERIKGSYLPGRTLGAFAGRAMIGTTNSMVMPMFVPGGAALPMAAVTRVGVRADHRRRGVLTALMREQLAAVAAAGEPLATLRASEYAIYGRYGYGVASRGRDVEVDPRRAAMHPAVPIGGRVRLLEPDEFGTVLPELYRRIDPRRPGALQRSAAWWQLTIGRPRSGDYPSMVAVHTGPDGDDGFVWYQAENNPTPEDRWGIRLQVDDLHAASMQAAAALWRFVLGVDLTNSVAGWLRPLDEPLELLLADARACRTVSVVDETWLRLVDVHAALGARSWADADPVVIKVRDAVLPANDGAYCITPDGAKRTDEAAQLELDVAGLARLYLGDVAPSVLAATGWLTVHDPAALPAADALFATGVVPWSGTYF
jgi:predicted acetyltransferase